MHLQSRRSYALLSIAAAVATLSLKFGAYALTGSVGLLSDALESLVNLVAAFVALWALTLAACPADDEHTYGHSKAEYFSSSVEGALIVIAAIGIVLTAVPRIIHPQPLEDIGLGLVIAAVAAIINGAMALVLLRAGERLRSIALRADGTHLLTDVWTTVGVLVGVALVGLTGWDILDPIIALLVAVNIVWTGTRLVHESGLGLMDTALPVVEQQTISQVLEDYHSKHGIEFHALRTRQAGSRRFVSFHVLVPGTWTVQRGHDACEEVELALRRVLPDTTIFTHLEPREDPTAFADQGLDRALDSASPANMTRR